jgi:hypothetical protein
MLNMNNIPITVLFILQSIIISFLIVDEEILYVFMICSYLKMMFLIILADSGNSFNVIA